jgi:recombination protein RecT
MSTQLAKTTPATLVQKMSGEFAKVLPKIITPERFARVMLSAVNKNAALKEALLDTRNQASVISAFMSCAEMGLEPDGRRATINCFRKKTGGYDVTLIPMYQGLCELAMRSGQISNIHADKVCENDVFEWDTGKITHKIDFRQDRGKVYAYYCHVTFKDGSVKTETMSLTEVEAIKQRSSSVKFGKSGPWFTDFDEMAKKTVFRRCSKWLPLSPELRSAFDEDDKDFRNGMDEDFGINFAANDKFAQEAGVVDETVPETPVEAEVVTDEKEEGLL